MPPIPLADPAAVAVLVPVAAYAVADARVRRRRGRVPRSHAALAFFAGSAVLLVALTGPLDAAVSTSFSAHMVQHLLLTMVAPPLMLLGAPLTLALLAWPGAPRRALLGAVRSRPARLLTRPVVAWSLFFGVLWGVHLTGFYDAALRSQGLHALEHIALLMTALLFWIPIVRVDPSPATLSYPARILYLFVAMPAMAFLGLVLVSARDPLYATYARAEGVARAISDQQMAGAIMWAGTMVLIVPALAFVLLDWMRADEREARRADERLARSAAGSA
jgi:putative copper resistance protein D